MVVTRTAFAAVLFGVATSVVAQAQPAPSVQLPKTEVVAPPPLSVRDFVRNPDIASPVLSRDGRHFAATAPINGRMNLVVIDLETRKGTALTNYANFDVISVNWVGSERIVYTLGQFNTPTGPGAADGGGLIMVSRDGKDTRVLAPTTRECRGRGERVCRQYRFLRSVPNSEEEIIATVNMRSADSDGVFPHCCSHGSVRPPSLSPFSGYKWGSISFSKPSWSCGPAESKARSRCCTSSQSPWRAYCRNAESVSWLRADVSSCSVS